MTSVQFRLDHVMVRVSDLGRSLRFYRDILGMEVLRYTEYEAGQFTNVFLRFANQSEAALELTYNWHQSEPYQVGNAFGHLALVVDDVVVAVDYLRQQGVHIKTAPKQMNHGQRIIAFVSDPDAYLIELLEPLSTAV